MRLLKRLVGLIMFIAAIITIIVFFMNFGNFSFREPVTDYLTFRSFSNGLAELVQQLFIPLVLLALGLIAMLLPSSRERKEK